MAASIVVAGCAKSSSEPPTVIPDSASAAASASSGSGGGESASGGGAGGNEGTAATGAGAGSMGNGTGSHSESGTRLKVASYNGEDGSKFIRTEAYDSLLGFHCSFQIAADGTTRCFPTSWAVSQLFADANCSVSLMMVPECNDDSPRFATLYERTQDSACSVRRHRAFALGEALIGATNVYALQAGECVSVQSLGSSFFYATEIPINDLALAFKNVEGT